MRVYFVRHGHTVLKEEGRHQFPETPLSDLGLRQAELVAARFEGMKIDKIFTSSHTRAFQTAEAIQSKTGLLPEVTSLFTERKYPSIFHGRIKDEPELQDVKALIKTHGTDDAWHHSDEENFSDFKNRGLQCLGLLENDDSETVVVVSHGYMISLLVLLMTFSEDVDLEMFSRYVKTFHHSTTGITFAEYKDTKWTVLTWNDYSHLEELYFRGKTK